MFAYQEGNLFSQLMSKSTYFVYLIVSFYLKQSIKVNWINITTIPLITLFSGSATDHNTSVRLEKADQHFIINELPRSSLNLCGHFHSPILSVSFKTINISCPWLHGNERRGRGDGIVRQCTFWRRWRRRWKSEEEAVIASLTVIIQTSSGRCTTDLPWLSNEFNAFVYKQPVFARHSARMATQLSNYYEMYYGNLFFFIGIGKWTITL